MIPKFFLKVLFQRGDNSDIDQQGRLMMAYRYGCRFMVHALPGKVHHGTTRNFTEKGSKFSRSHTPAWECIPKCILIIQSNSVKNSGKLLPSILYN